MLLCAEARILECARGSLWLGDVERRGGVLEDVLSEEAHLGRIVGQPAELFGERLVRCGHAVSSRPCRPPRLEQHDQPHPSMNADTMLYLVSGSCTTC